MSNYTKINHCVIPGLTRNPLNKYRIGTIWMDSCLRRNDSTVLRSIAKIAILSVLLLTSVICHPPSVSAAGYGLSIYPPLLRVNIKPGKSITQVFKIDNLTNDDKLFVARLVPFTDADLLGNPVINLQSTAPWLTYFSLANTNIKIGDPFTIKGGSSEQLILSLSVPDSAPLRDLYVTLLISTYLDNNNVTYQGTLVSATTGSNLLVTISSEAFPSTLLHIEDIVPVSGATFKIGRYYFSDNITPVSFSASVANSGDYNAETKGLFKITARDDQPVYLEGILPMNVISKTKRTLINNDGNRFTFSPNLGNMGLHKMVVSIKTDNANAENSIYVIFLPFKITLGISFAVTFLIVIFQTTKIKKDHLDIDLD